MPTEVRDPLELEFRVTVSLGYREPNPGALKTATGAIFLELGFHKLGKPQAPDIPVCAWSAGAEPSLPHPQCYTSS